MLNGVLIMMKLLLALLRIVQVCMCPLARGAGKSLTATNLSLKVPLASS